MTVFTAVFLACTLGADSSVTCKVQQGRAYTTQQECVDDTLARATQLNALPGPHKVALLPGKICMKTEETAA